MKANRLLGALLAAGLGLAAVTATTEAAAQKGKTKKEAPAQVAAEAPMTKKPIVILPVGIAYGMNPKQVAEVIDKTLDEVYRPLYQQVSPGVKMKALDAALAEEKSTFRRGRIDFGKLPTGIDASPLKGEYTYLNKESMMSFTREGKTQYFFFIGDKLWKIVHELKLAEGSPNGKDYTAFTVKLAKDYGVPGRVLAADPAKGRMSTEVDWKDSASHLRAVQRGDAAAALIVEDNATLANLASLRVNKPAEENAIDPAVAAALSKGGPPPGPPEDKAAAKPKGKK
jgi:hypothetical protein